jgi:hypothetical protein
MIVPPNPGSARHHGHGCYRRDLLAPKRYAITLAELGPHGADLITATLASGDKDGYVFIMTATAGGYTIQANPKVFGRSGYRTFYTDQDGVIRQNWSAEPATASSPEFK